MSNSVDRHLLACSAMAGALLLPVVDVPTADAALYTSTATVTIATGYTVYVDVDYSSGTVLLSSIYTGYVVPTFASYPTAEFAIVFSSYGIIYDNAADTKAVYFYATGPAAGAPALSYASPIAAAATISGTSYTPTYLESGATIFAFGAAPYGGWTSGTAYLGFSLYDTATKTTTYGWLGVSLTAVPPVMIGTTAGAAWGSVGESVVTGVVPEPSSWALAVLALGALGVGNWRRRRIEDA